MQAAFALVHKSRSTKKRTETLSLAIRTADRSGSRAATGQRNVLGKHSSTHSEFHKPSKVMTRCSNVIKSIDCLSSGGPWDVLTKPTHRYAKE